MNDTAITKESKKYEAACSACADDLFHVAYLALVDEEQAEDIVMRVCKAGVHKYDNLEDEEEIRFRLTSDLYHQCKRRLLFRTPNTGRLPTQLQVLSKQDRLLAAMYFSSGLPSASAADIVGMKHDEYTKTVLSIMRKVQIM